MKTYCSLLLVFLGLFAHASYAQTSPSATGSGPIIPTSDNFGYVLMQSRDAQGTAEPFAVGKPLYPVLEKSRPQANAVMRRTEGEVTLFQFANGIPNRLTLNSLRTIEAAAQTRQATLRRVSEANPLFWSSDAYSITVFRSGVFVYRTVAYAGQMVTVLTIPIDNVPKKPYYYDFREQNYRPGKPVCYDTLTIKQLSLTYQGVGIPKPKLDWFRFANTERHRPVVGIRPGNIDNPVGYLNIVFDSLQVQYIRNVKTPLRLQYKLRGIPTIFTLNVLILFGCEPLPYPSSQTIIYPTGPGSRMTEEESGQPDPTQVGVVPPQRNQSSKTRSDD